jgi:hypothetical protein
MSRFMALTLGSLLLCANAWGAAGETGSAAVIAIHCGHLIDTQAGKLLGETTVVISAKRIEAVQAGAKPRQAARRSILRMRPACRGSSTVIRI